MSPQSRRKRHGQAGIITVLCLLGALCADAQAAIAFGVRTQIWPFLFAEKSGTQPGYTADEKMKLEVALGNLDRYAELGATWNIVDVWQVIDGSDGFRRLDRVVAEHERREIQVALRLLERPEIYDSIRNGGAAAAAALDDYRAWTTQIARRYGARVRYYMISNEADHDIGYNRPSYRAFRHVTVDEYRGVLRTAYEAIHAVDPKLRVTDHGVSAYSLALAVMDDLALGGRPGDALALWRSLEFESPNEGERTLARLVATLANGESRRRIEFARRSTAELTPYRDVFQLHHYYGPGSIPTLLAWVRHQLARTNAGQPIVAAEVGYQIPSKLGKSWDGRQINVADMDRYSERDHGRSVAETVAALAGNGVEDILYWQMRFHVAIGTAASLYTPTSTRNDFRATYPVRVFQFVSRELTGATAVQPTPGLGAEVTEYRFHREREFSIAWSQPGERVEMPRALRDRVARVTGAAGAEAPPGAGPYFVYWRTGTATP